MWKTLDSACMKIFFCGAVALSCSSNDMSQTCPALTEKIDLPCNSFMGFFGVDILFVVDDPSSIASDKSELSAKFFDLINFLAFPTPDWKYGALEDVRIAVVSSDIGLRWGGRDYEDGDGWPYECDNPKGNDGRFISYENGYSIDIKDQTIRCDRSGGQCPKGWSCNNIGTDDVGRCAAADSGGSNQRCPDKTSEWAEKNLEDDNGDIAFQTACLAGLGTKGCGIKQQLEAASVGLRSHRTDFIRSGALLAVVVISNEDDCSIEDGPALFSSEEIKSGTRKSVACGNNERFLYEINQYRNDLVQLKGSATAVYFAAIVGVPPGSACEGRGNEIGTCLEQNKMKKTETTETVDGLNTTVFAPACTREDAGVEAIKATPGTRYVELAQEFGSFSYVYSICNNDWRPALEDMTELVKEVLCSICFPQQLDWDPQTQKTGCEMLVTYVDPLNDKCPFALPDGYEPAKETWVDKDEIEHTNVYCPIPELGAPLNCADAKKKYPRSSEEFGWYYCENLEDENYNMACDPKGDWAGIDEDSDGKIDCEDESCWNCIICEDYPGVDPLAASSRCFSNCKFDIVPTTTARETVMGKEVKIRCLSSSSPDDVNCATD